MDVVTHKFMVWHFQAPYIYDSILVETDIACKTLFANVGTETTVIQTKGDGVVVYHAGIENDAELRCLLVECV